MRDIFSKTADSVVSSVHETKASISNFTSNFVDKISEGTKKLEAKITGGARELYDTIWSYVEWAGIILSVIASGLLLILAAPLIEVVIFGYRWAKIPFVAAVRSYRRLASNLNKKATENTQKLINKAKHHYERRTVQRRDLFNLRRMA